jgi:hypothetical protein
MAVLRMRPHGPIKPQKTGAASRPRRQPVGSARGIGHSARFLIHALGEAGRRLAAAKDGAEKKNPQGGLKFGFGRPSQGSIGGGPSPPAGLAGRAMVKMTRAEKRAKRGGLGRTRAQVQPPLEGRASRSRRSRRQIREAAFAANSRAVAQKEQDGGQRERQGPFHSHLILFFSPRHSRKNERRAVSWGWRIPLVPTLSS